MPADTRSLTSLAAAAALDLRGVGFRFGPTQILNDISLQVPRGSITAIMGPSGSGKTTLTRIIAGFLFPSEGSVAIGGRDMCAHGRHVPANQRKLGIVPQDGALFPHLDVRANVGFGLARRHPNRQNRQNRQNRIDECLELVGLAHLAKRRPSELSGGQQQRVAVARALAPSPDLVIMDEPFSALDAGLREATRAAVVSAIQASNATVLMVTHDSFEALTTADQVAVLVAGTLAQIDTPARAYDTPATAEVAMLTGHVTSIRATGHGDHAKWALGSVSIAAGSAIGSGVIIVRPEQVRIDADANGVKVVGRSVIGPDLWVDVQVIADGSTLRCRCTRSDYFAVGDEVGLTVMSPALFVAGVGEGAAGPGG